MKEKLEIFSKRINFKFPIIGAFVRRYAAKEIAKYSEFESLPFLIKALNSFDCVVVEIVKKKLESYKDKSIINKLCEIWFETRNEKLGLIINAQNYIAVSPEIVRVATILKSDNIDLCDNPNIIKEIISFLDDEDFTIRTNAKKGLQKLKTQKAIDKLCKIIAYNDIIKYKKEAIDIAIKAKHHPKDISIRSLFFLMTSQIEKYFEADFEFQYLRAEYEAASNDLKEEIRSVIKRIGDKRLLELFGEIRKRKISKKISEKEAVLLIDVYKRNKQFEEIFSLIFFTELKFAPEIIGFLVEVNWLPSNEVETDLFNNLVVLCKKLGKPPKMPQKPEIALGKVINKWIALGRTDAYIKLKKVKLIDILIDGNPPEAISALSALFEKDLLINKDFEYIIKNNHHWMVRLAYFALVKEDDNVLKKNADFFQGESFWFNKFIPAIKTQKITEARAYEIKLQELQLINDAMQKNDADNILLIWAEILYSLASFSLKNTIIIDKYQKKIDDTAISL